MELTNTVFTIRLSLVVLSRSALLRASTRPHVRRIVKTVFDNSISYYLERLAKRFPN